MSHIHTNPGQHDLTASAYVIRTDFDQPKLMLHWHEKLNKLMMFGGHVELDENPWQALAHELREESGYDMSELTLLQPKGRIQGIDSGILHPYPVSVITVPYSNDHNHIDLNYAFVASGPPKQEPLEGNSSDMSFMSREELISISSNEIFEDVRKIALYIFDECLPNWERVEASGK